MGPHHILESANEMQRKLLGSRIAIGSPLQAAFPEAGLAGVFEKLDRVFTSGETLVEREQAHIGMQLACQAAKRLLDLGVVGARRLLPTSVWDAALRRQYPTP